MSSEKGPFQKEIILTTQHFSRALSCLGRVLYPLHGSKFRPSNQPERRNAANHPPICGPWSSMWLDIRLDLAMMALWHTVPWCKIEERNRSQISKQFLYMFLHIPNQICFKNCLFLGILLKELYWTSIVNGFASYIVIFPNQQYHLILSVAETSWWKCYGNIFRNLKGSEKQAVMK